MAHMRRLTVTALVALALSSASTAPRDASDPRHETGGDPNPQVVALTNGDPGDESGRGADPIG